MQRRGKKEVKKIGRPSDYTPELLEKAKGYLATCVDTPNGLHLDVNLPSVAGLAVYLGVARTTIYDWASQDDKREFSNILQKILAEQEKRLINKGLSGDYNSNIAKLALGKHGYSDRQELTGKDGKDLYPSPEEREKADKALEQIGFSTNDKE